MRNESNEETRPPGTIATLTAGFELTTSHWWLILLPVILDLFYWLGPRLSVQALMERSAAVLTSEPAIRDMVEQTVSLASGINLFTSISLPIIGIPTLMSGPIPEATPLMPAVLEVDQTGVWLLVFVGLSSLGLMLTVVYLSLISLAIKSGIKERVPPPQRLIQEVVARFVRLIGLIILFVILLIAIMVPLLPLALLLGQVSGGLVLLVLMAGFVLIVTYLCLAVPGIVFGNRPLLKAVPESVRLVRSNLLPLVNLLLLILVIGNVMNLLWHMADDGSWLTLVSIFGHGFISSALASALFIFYKDRLAALNNETSVVAS